MEKKSLKEYSVVLVVEGEKFKLRKLPSRSPSLFSSRWQDCPVLKHSRVSEVFKGFNVHDFEHCGQRNYDLKWEFNFFHYMCHLLFIYVDVEKKKLRKRAQI